MLPGTPSRVDPGRRPVLIHALRPPLSLLAHDLRCPAEWSAEQSLVRCSAMQTKNWMSQKKGIVPTVTKSPPAAAGSHVKRRVWEPELRSAEDAVTLKELLHFELNSYGEVRGHRLAVQLRRFILPVA